MANLLNVIDSSVPKTMTKIPSGLKPVWDSKTGEQDHAQWLKAKAESTRADDVQKWVSKVVTEADKAVDDLCWDTFLKEDQLPVPMKDRAPNVLTKMMGTPRANLGGILDVTTKLGFVILPYEYVDPDAWKAEPHDMQTAIKEFGRLGGETVVEKDYYGRVTKETTYPARLDVYVVCPPIYYSLERHLAAKDPNKAIFAGKNDQAFMALGLTLPTLRMMTVQIATLEENQKAMREDYNRMRSVVERTAQDVEALRKQVSSLQENVENQLSRMQEMIDGEIRSTVAAAVQSAATSLDKEAAKEILKGLGPKASLKDAREALSALEAIKFRIEEPLMFALKRGSPLRDPRGEAFLGPCWGPDFADIIATAVGLSPNKERRTQAETMLTVWAPAREGRASARSRETYYGDHQAYGSAIENLRGNRR